MLGLSAQTRVAPRPGQPMPQQTFGAARFLLPVQQCEFQLTGILEALARDPWPFPNTGARIMLFAGGPATEGPGMVVSNELKELIRSHHDIERDSVKHFKRATKVWSPNVSNDTCPNIFSQFYEGLAKRASNNGHAVDLFVGCLGQVGLLQMKSLPNSTNGVMVLSDSFATSIFKQSFLQMFNKDDQDKLEMGFNATFDVQVIRPVYVFVDVDY
jgi:protein transport protein SEC23